MTLPIQVKRFIPIKIIFYSFLFISAPQINAAGLNPIAVQPIKVAPVVTTPIKFVPIVSNPIKCPVGTELVKAKPGSNESDKCKPVVVVPVKVVPIVTEPIKVDPVKVVPIVTEPIKVDPVKVVPIVTEPIKVDPVKVVPIVTEPIKVDPVKVVPIVTEPIKVDPVKVVPIVTEPIKVDPVKVVPIVTEPIKVDPVKVVPIVTEPIKVDPVKVVPVVVQPIIKPVVTKPIIPVIVNPELLPVAIKPELIPAQFNPKVASVVVESGFKPYLSLNLDILYKAKPLAINTGPKTYQFKSADEEGWFVLFADGKRAVDIKILSTLDLQYEVLNEEGTTLTLNQIGGIDPGFAAGFYYIHVINLGNILGDFTVEGAVFYISGGNLFGKVTDQCNNQPIARASLSIETIYVSSHTDGSFQFSLVNPIGQTINAFAEGYQSGQVVVTAQESVIVTADIALTPLGGCPSTETVNGVAASTETGAETETPTSGETTTGTETGTGTDTETGTGAGTNVKPEPKVFLKTPVIYNHVTGVVDFVDVEVTGLPGEAAHYRAQLKNSFEENGFLFDVSSLEEITNSSNKNVSASYDYNELTLTIPLVQAFGKNYSVVLNHNGDFRFRLVSAVELN